MKFFHRPPRIDTLLKIADPTSADNKLTIKNVVVLPIVRGQPIGDADTSLHEIPSLVELTRTYLESDLDVLNTALYSFRALPYGPREVATNLLRPKNPPPPPPKHKGKAPPKRMPAVEFQRLTLSIAGATFPRASDLDPWDADLYVNLDTDRTWVPAKQIGDDLPADTVLGHCVSTVVTLCKAARATIYPVRLELFNVLGMSIIPVCRQASGRRGLEAFKDGRRELQNYLFSVRPKDNPSDGLPAIPSEMLIVG